MTRAVVFKTPGKLDLRSITMFGMNAKPMTTSPIGFFGTGLKYAIAVLSREKIPVTLYINRKQWVIEADPSSFRGKDFTELYICSTTIGGLIKKRIKLPFTTELGKTWKLWQAFRELESNTRDELGETFIATEPDIFEGHTYIIVESDSFVQEYYDREKTFLPGGLTQRQGTEDVQVFDRPSDAIYYRGIRVLDLKEDERSQLTYNILRQMELTEDRTLKSKWDAEYYISQASVRQKDPDIVKKIVTAEKETFEAKLNFSYSSPSKEFLDTLEGIEHKELQPSARSILKTYRPPLVKARKIDDWLQPIIDAIKGDEYDALEEVIGDHKEKLVTILQKAQASSEYAERSVGSSDNTTQEESDSNVESNRKETENVDDIPF